MANRLHICIEQRLPRVRLLDAATVAIRENPSNHIHELQLEILGAVLTSKKWKPGRELRVRHLNGDDALRARVETQARSWEEHANLTLKFQTAGDAEIRIKYDSDGHSWSYLGTDALVVDKETMHFGWLTPESSDEELRRVVLHEFGHALGMIHEHQHPEAGIQWNRQAVYDYYQKELNWTKQDVDDQIFSKIDKKLTQFSAYDKLSIMHYPVPAEFTTNNQAVDINTHLSGTDQTFIAGVYPK